MKSIDFDKSLGTYTYLIQKLDKENIDKLISFVRQGKQHYQNYLIIQFSENLEEIPEVKSVSDRLSWSKEGQLLTRFIRNSPCPVIGIANGDLFNEYLEIFLSCSSLFIKKDSKFSLKSSKFTYLSRFGLLRSLNESNLGHDLKSPLFFNELESISRSLLDLKTKEYFTNNNELEVKVRSHLKESLKELKLARRLFSVNNSESPMDIKEYEYLESTIYSNQPYEEIIERLISKVDSPPINLEEMSFEKNLDDLAQDYLNFSYYPDHEIQALDKKFRLKEVELLLKQEIAPIKGKCIELGSGYGYFSCLVSRSKRVEEIVALDISMTEIFQLGPFMWERLKPDWNKLKFRITDMNKIQDSYGSFDTVIFCASLHHSADKPASLSIANKLLKPGGSLILHGEHWDPIFFRPRKRAKSSLNTITDFSKLLRSSGFKTYVYRYALPRGRLPFKLKKIIFTWFPFKYLNGILRFADFMILGKKI